MFKKGRKREAKGLAVVYFIIGLIILLIILAVIYFALVELDYSDRIRDPEATIRAYVEATLEPDTFDADDAFANGYGSELDVDLTADIVDETPEPTEEPTPEPTATPEPTPAPTPIPVSMLSPSKTDGFKLPTPSANVVAGITSCYVSEPDNNKYMYMTGYGFINEAGFNGSGVQSYLIVNQSKTGKSIAYQVAMKAGVSGDAHADALCQSAASTDFEVCIDVGQNYTDDIYTLGLVIGYPGNNNKTAYAYYAFPSDISFTVLSGQVASPVFVAQAEAADDGAIADNSAETDEIAGADVSDFDDTDSFDDFDDDAFDADSDDADYDAGAFDTGSAAQPQGITSAEELYEEQMITG